MPVFPGSSGLIYQNLPSYQQMHGFSENPVYVPGFLWYPMQDPQSYSANRKTSKDENSESDEESSESDEEGSESDEDDETTPVENNNYFEERFSTSRNWLPSVTNKLDMIGLEKWARVHFPENLCSSGTLIIDKQQCLEGFIQEIIYDVGHPSEWEQPNGLITVLPPLMDKRPPERPRNRDRFRSKGEQIKQK
nr:hypothetical protein [Tanacetum cinerariifolium]